jgi:hypothetical protein
MYSFYNWKNRPHGKRFKRHNNFTPAAFFTDELKKDFGVIGFRQAQNKAKVLLYSLSFIFFFGVFLPNLT